MGVVDWELLAGRFWLGASIEELLVCVGELLVGSFWFGAFGWELLVGSFWLGAFGMLLGAFGWELLTGSFWYVFGSVWLGEFSPRTLPQSGFNCRRIGIYERFRTLSIGVPLATAFILTVGALVLQKPRVTSMCTISMGVAQPSPSL